MKLFLFTTDTEFAKDAEQGGVYSIIVDWENKGKQSRQVGYDVEINADSPEDVTKLKRSIKIPITVRVNELNEETPQEIDLALQSGADIIMLPMARSAKQVETFLKIVNKRAKTLVQIETPELVSDLTQFAQLDWDFTYIGLNDLMISRGGTHIWEAVADGTVEKICAKLKGREYGFGGATVVDGGKPIPFSLLLHEYTRLGCSISFMRRTFRREVRDRNVVEEIKKTVALIKKSKSESADELLEYHAKLVKQLKKQDKKAILVMYSSHEVSPQHLEKLQQIAPEYEVVKINSEIEAQVYASRAEIILGHRYLRQTLGSARSLKWVQTTGAGVDRLPLTELEKKHVLLTRATNSSSVIAQNVYVIYSKLIEKAKVSPAKTVLILGYGHIGTQVAKVFKLQEQCSVWAVKRSSDFELELQPQPEKLFTDNSWEKNLSQVDLVVLCLPLTKHTANFFSKKHIDALPKHAVIINVGRGETLEEEVVIKNLTEKKLAGFGTDVLGEYLKNNKNIKTLMQQLPFMYTYYTAAHYPNRGADVEQFIESQLVAYLNKTKMQNVVSYEEV